MFRKFMLCAVSMVAAATLCFGVTPLAAEEASSADRGCDLFIPEGIGLDDGGNAYMFGELVDSGSGESCGSFLMPLGGCGTVGLYCPTPAQEVPILP